MAARPSRSSASIRFSNRDTCICEIPTRSAICDCVISPTNRNARIRRSRSGNSSINGTNDSWCSTSSIAGSSSPTVSANGARSSEANGVSSSDTDRYACRATYPSSTSATAIPRCALSSDTDGERPNRCDSADDASLIDNRSSCNRRGTRNGQLASRKCRRTSPITVGTAYDRKSAPGPDRTGRPRE
ncbi:hypothetical protein GCM10029992_07180 [Glycomyces albus]